MYASSMRENREGPPIARPLIKGGPPGEGQGHKPELGGHSDSPVVPTKPANKPARGEAAHTQAEAESVEERGLAKGNTESAACSGHWAGNRAPRALDRVRQVAKRDKEARLTALLHHVSAESRTCTTGSTGERTDRSLRGGCTYRKRMGGCGRSG